MIKAIQLTQIAGAKNSRPQVRKDTAEAVYIYAFDVAYEMTRTPVRELLGQPVAQFVVDASKRSPRQLFFYRPQMVRLPPLERIGPWVRFAWKGSSNCFRSAQSASPSGSPSLSIMSKSWSRSTISNSATVR